MSNVIVVIGAGSIGQAIARRVSAGKRVLLADLRPENADAAAEVLSNAGFEVRTAAVDVSSRDSCSRACGSRHGARRCHGSHPRRWGIAVAGLAGDDPQGRSLWNRAGAGRIRQCHRERRVRRRHRIAVRPPPGRVDCRAERGVGADSRGRSAGASDAPAGSGQGTSSMPTSSRSEAMRCALWPRPCAGAAAAPGSTRSAPASSLRRSRRTNRPAHAAKAIGA